MKKIPKLKPKGVPIRISNHYPEEMREKRKRLYDLQNSYKEKNISTTIKADKLVSNNNGSVYCEKIARPKTCDILEDPSDKNPSEIHQGKQIEDNGNRFTSHATKVSSVKQVNQVLRDIFRISKVSSATHNIYAYIFTNEDGVMHEGSDDDGEHGAGRALLQKLKDRNVSNCVVVVVSRWFSGKIGARRFRHILEVGMSAVTSVK
ncbi:protein IMPACT-B-like [Ostrea edulis]|uniref:protein IMPACT-B-like n=1 Tax=Ostrea edulis TaxID=37623 RepID=UPI0024AEFCE0|nr:protein IMPACT-B-like [Ostrea edulis]